MTRTAIYGWCVCKEGTYESVLPLFDERLLCKLAFASSWPTFQTFLRRACPLMRIIHATLFIWARLHQERVLEGHLKQSFEVASSRRCVQPRRLAETLLWRQKKKRCLFCIRLSTDGFVRGTALEVGPRGLDILEKRHLRSKTMGAAILFPKFLHKLQCIWWTKWLPNAYSLVYSGL